MNCHLQTTQHENRLKWGLIKLLFSNMHTECLSFLDELNETVYMCIQLCTYA